MPTNSPSKPDPPLIWAVVVDHRNGQFLSRMCLTLAQCRSANLLHIRKNDGIRVYDESDAIKAMTSMTPLGMTED